MKVYKCILKIRSPTIVGDARSMRGFYTATNVIPGHTVGGAVNRVLLGEGISDSILISSPAYPVLNGCETLPAHPFCYECKVCEGNIFSTLEKVDLRQLVRAGWDGIKEQLISLRCENLHLVKSLHPMPVALVEGRVGRIAVQPIISVGMNRHTAASQYGLLYEYLAIEPGQEYWFTLASRDGPNVPDEFEVRIGRGTSRGYGRALIKVKEAYMNPSIPCNVDGDVMLYALSPIPLRFLSNPINLSECAARYGLDGVDGELEIIYIEGRPAAFGKIRILVAGWPRGAPISRERIACLSAGSIIACRWRTSPSDPVRALTALRYFGIPIQLGSGSVEGLCMLYPFDREPLREVR